MDVNSKSLPRCNLVIYVCSLFIYATLYFIRLFTSVKNTKDITRASIKSLLSEAYSDIESMSSMSFTQELTYSDAKVLPRRTIVDIRRNGRQIVSFVNSLAHESIQLVSILVNSPNVMVSALLTHCCIFMCAVHE